jgi:hypothetical protein
LIEVNKHHDPIPALVFFLHKTKDMGLPAMFYFMFRGAHQLHLDSGYIRFSEIDLLLSWLLQCVLSRLTPIATCLPFESLVQTSVWSSIKEYYLYSRLVCSSIPCQYQAYKPIHQSTEFFGGEFLPFYQFYLFLVQMKEFITKIKGYQKYFENGIFYHKFSFSKFFCQKLSQLLPMT